jgi:hypothetical protein
MNKVSAHLGDQTPETKVHVEIVLNISGGDIDEDPLAVIRGITRGIKALDPTLREAVHVARRQRRTWEEIGEALGVTRQSAWERFATE